MLAEVKKECCGCGVCVQVCKFHAISLVTDQEGFWYPKIDKELCKDCHVCEMSCAFLQGLYQDNEFSKPIAYAVKHKDIDIRMDSRSGGSFTALSDWILDRKGIVYGCGYDENFQAVHKRADTKEKRDELRGSKYVQSHVEQVFKQIKEDLCEGKEVLFSGTSCQAASLKKYLEHTNQDKLYLIDILCFGVPSPKVWNDYLKFMGNRYHDIVTGVNFRNKKKYGWKKHVETIEVGHVEHDSRIYAKLFSSLYMLRPSCYVCPYKHKIHPADISLGDFWGIDTAVEGFNDDKGVSLVLLNNAKGKRLFEAVQDELECVTCNVEQSKQKPLNGSRPAPEDRSEFWEMYNQKGFYKTICHYSFLSRKEYMKEQVKLCIKRILHA